MNPLQSMEVHKPFFTPNDFLIYETISANPEQMVHMSTSALAEACGVSQPALSRFVKSLGYNRYQDFRAELIACLAQKDETAATDSGRLRYFNTLYQVLNEAEKHLTSDFMLELLSYMNQFKKIFATGTSKSYQPAQLLQILSYKTGRNIQAIPRDFLFEAGDYMRETDLLIIFSVSGTSQIVKEISHVAGKLMIVTTNPNHALQEIVDRTVVLPYITSDPESSSISPVLFDVFVELLVSFMIQERRLTADD